MPGTSHLRTSILAVWADMLAGLLASVAMGPRVPVTLELDVHLYRPAPGSGTIRAVGRTVKAGRSVFVAAVEFTSTDGEPVAVGAGSFMAAPDPAAVLPRSEDGLNSSNTVNGGLIALTAEEAVLSLVPGDTLCSLGLRCLQAVRAGAAVATARIHDGLGQAEVRDAGNDNRLSVTATARTFGR